MSGPKPSRKRRPRSAERLGRARGSVPAFGREPNESAADVAEYIAKMSTELAKLAGGARLNTLTYFLNLARLEAEAHIPKLSSPPN